MAVIAIPQLQTGMVVIMERAQSHTGTADPHSMISGSLDCRYGCFHLLEQIHFSFLLMLISSFLLFGNRRPSRIFVCCFSRTVSRRQDIALSLFLSELLPVPDRWAAPRCGSIRTGNGSSIPFAACSTLHPSPSSPVCHRNWHNSSAPETEWLSFHPWSVLCFPCSQANPPFVEMTKGMHRKRAHPSLTCIMLDLRKTRIIPGQAKTDPPDKTCPKIFEEFAIGPIYWIENMIYCRLQNQ